VGSAALLSSLLAGGGEAGTVKSMPLGDGLATVGVPSLDWFYDLIHVGTEAGICRPGAAT
jgi:hypothetical protein